jgi:type II secretory pathway component GspD/PulD (secretin)
MEEIGVRWTTLDGLLALPNGQTDGYARNTDTFAHNGSLINNLPATAFNVQPASANTGLTLHGTLLGATQLSAILTAVERDARGLILESPSVTTVSGVRANSFFGKQFAYIADYTVGGAVGALSATLDPTIEVLNLGASLDIKPFVSADGKYVTMEFRPALATLESLFVETLLVPRFLPLGNGGNGNGNGVILGNVVILPFPIELPNIKVRELSTTITVPDGGTLLVGGFGKHLEQTMSTKIPFLGHIPFLGRLFGQRGRYSDRSKLYLLADVHVINYAELEAKL